MTAVHLTHRPLPDRLRYLAGRADILGPTVAVVGPPMEEAADEIERLTADLADAEQVAQDIGQLQRAMAIVVHLASEPAPIVGESTGCPVCVLCGGDAPAGVTVGVHHRDDCPWTAARALLADITAAPS